MLARHQGGGGGGGLSGRYQASVLQDETSCGETAVRAAADPPGNCQSGMVCVTYISPVFKKPG